MNELPQPGIHSGDADQYFSASGLSRSMLRELSFPRTPAHFKARYIDKITGPEEETDAMRLGTLTHRVVLEPDTCVDAFHVRPDGMKFTTKEGMAWRDAHSDKPIITAEQSAAMLGMRESVLAHPIARRVIANSNREQNVFADADGVRLKARLDLLPHNGNLLADLKTCEDASEGGFSKSIDSYRYDYQAAFYIDVCNLVGKDFSQWLFIAVEKDPPYLCAIYALDAMAIEYGRRLYKRDLQLYRTCMETGKWPGYPPELQQISLPSYRQKDLESL